MNYGGRQVDERVAQTVRFMALFIPLLLFLYGVLIVNGVIVTDNYLGSGILFAITVPWSLLAVYQFLYPARRASTFAVQLGLYHFFALFFALGVSGFNSPFGAAWILLLILSHLYFGGDGLRLSIFVFFGAVVGDMYLYAFREDTDMISIPAILSVISILFVAAVIIAMTQTQENSSEELEQSKQNEALQQGRIEALINNLADAFISTDSKGVVQLYNAAALNLLDTNRDLEGLKLSEILPLRDEHDARLDSIKLLQSARTVVSRDDISLTSGDETLRLEITYSPIRGSNDTAHEKSGSQGYVVILRDITKAKSLEEERDEFISVVSHELRTPIAVAEGTISNLQLMMDRPEIAQSLLSENVEKAHEQILYLARMVNDLSTLSRAERGLGDTPEEIQVRELINELFSEYTPQAERKGLTLNLDLGHHLGSVTTSRLYLKELLQNFVSNAIKYTKEGSVTIKAVRKDTALTFSVKDTGIGISKSEQDKIFHKFYRSEDYRTRETGGTGLGLYVASKLARKLSTEIELTSRLNHGSTFSFTVEGDTPTTKRNS